MDGIGYPDQWQPVRSNCRVPSGPMAFSSTCSDCFTCETCSVTMKVDGMGKRHEWKEQMNGSTHRGKTCYIGISMLIYVLSIRLKVHWNLGNSSNTAATIPGSKRLLKYQWLRTWRGWSQVVTIHPKSASLWNEHGSYSNPAGFHRSEEYLQNPANIQTSSESSTRRFYHHHFIVS